MTDEKYYIVSETALQRLTGAAFSEAVDQLEGNELTDDLEKAKMVCRAIPISEESVARILLVEKLSSNTAEGVILYTE